MESSKLNYDNSGVLAEEIASHSYRLPKKLIVCCDGTWMDSDNGWVPGQWGQPGHLQNPTNVTRISRAIKSEDDHHHPQIVYYQAGIGTGIGIWNHLVGGGTGLGLAENIREAYAFVAENYAEHRDGVPADSIFLVGFSRGAFTARSLSGFICAMGILKKHAMSHFYEVFEDWERAGDPHYKPMFFTNYFKHHTDVEPVHPDYTLAKSKKPSDRDAYLADYFNKMLALGVTQRAIIKCVGVWDTVGALGIPVNPLLQRIFPFLPSFLRTYRWFDTRLDDQIKNAFHGLALDERRFPYSPAVWEKPPGCHTNLHQVWFPGAHSNVGGSYEDSGMANITLAWMMDHLSGNMIEDKVDFEHHDWIQFDEEFIEWWYDCQLSWYEEHKEAAYKGWARGKIYESNTFPQSLAGSRTRRPGNYHRTFYESGKTDWSKPLVNTNEYIHSSVRARVDMGGRSVEPDWSQVLGHGGWNIGPLLKSAWKWLTRQREETYQPQRQGEPLHGWKLVDGHHSHRDPNYDIGMSPDGLQEVRWVWEGDGKISTKFMAEAKLGKYERLLLQKDESIANAVEFSNNGWHWLKRTKLLPHYGRTFPI